MDKLKKYMTLNRKREWQRGLKYQLVIKDNKMEFNAENKESYQASSTCIFITGSIDSTNLDYRWTKLIIDADIPEGAILKVNYIASNAKKVFIEDEYVELDEWIKKRTRQKEEGMASIKQLDGLFKKEHEKIGTELLIDAVGRYLWIKITCVFNESRHFCLNKIKIGMLEEHLIDYLPQLYRDHLQEDDFLFRFMALFEDIFFDIETTIDTLASRMDYTLTDKRMLDFLAKWLCITDGHNYSIEKLREMIGALGDEYSLIGTKRGLEMMIKREIGITPKIIEYAQLKDLLTTGENKELYQRLFSDNPYKFFVLLPNKIFYDGTDIKKLMNKIEAHIPSYTEVEIVPLKEGIILDEHTYIGVNTHLSGYDYVAVDKGDTLSHNTIIGGDDNAK